MTARVAVDLNVRVRGNQTYAGFEDVDVGLAPGDLVEVYEAESGFAGQARITDVDNARRLVYLTVDWGELRETRASGKAASWTSAFLSGVASRLQRAADRLA
jgi:hypothetical protein